MTREAAKRLAESLGIDETPTIHLALRELAVKLLPQYEADDGALTANQLCQIRKRVPQGSGRSARSALFDVEATALILAVFDDDGPKLEVRVGYGTTQRSTCPAPTSSSRCRPPRRTASRPGWACCIRRWCGRCRRL